MTPELHFVIVQGMIIITEESSVNPELCSLNLMKLAPETFHHMFLYLNVCLSIPAAMEREVYMYLQFLYMM